MCDEHVMKVVQQRLKQEPQLSRRNFLRAAGITAAGVAVASRVARPRPAFAQEMMGEVVDLSHILSTDVPLYAGAQPTRETLVTVENDGFYSQLWTFGEHSGTHVDAPGHFTAGGTLIDQVEASGLVGPAAVVDISARAAEDADAMVMVEDLMAWEEANGEIPAGAFVAMYSGWEAFWDDDAAFKNTGDDGLYHFPGFGADAVNWLLENRDINGVLVDTMSLDIGASSTFDVHINLLGAGKIGVENVANLSSIMGQQAMVMVGVPRYQEGSGGPCRVLAMI